MGLGFFRVISFFLKYSKGIAIFSIIIGIIAGASSAALISLINARVTNPSSPSADSVYAFVGITFLVLLSTTVSGILSTHLGQRASLDLRMHLTRRILDTPLRRIEEAGPHRILAVLTQDIPTIVSAFLRVPQFFIVLAIVSGCLVYLGRLSLSMLLLLIGFVILAIISYVIPLSKANYYLSIAREEFDALVNHFRTLTTGAKELKLHRQRREKFTSDVLLPTAKSLRRYNLIGGDLYTFLSAWSQMLYFILIGVILFAMPGLTSHTNTHVLSGYALTVLYMIGPLHAIVTIIPSFSGAQISLRKIEELGLSLTASELRQESVVPTTPTAFREQLDLIGVTHSYYREREEASFTLGPIDLSIQRGELVFIAGGNGSGKTTLAKLLCGLYKPESGEVRIDGEPVTDENREEYRQQFSAIFSEFHIFEELLGLDDTDLDNTARTFLAKLQLDHKVTVNKGKLSTTELSYGQRKRLALLVAYLEDRAIYIFDEWAADQDPRFKDVFYYDILPGLKAEKKAAFVITHDEKYYPIADRVVRLDSGKIENDRNVFQQPTWTQNV